jgi:hypothetical protein
MTARKNAAGKAKRAAPRRSYKPGAFDLKVRRSSAGMGLFVGATPIPKGACVIEYTGKVLEGEDWQGVNSKYLFEVSSRKTIDGSPRWNTARYINHSCRPNCEPEIYKGRVFIFAKRAIKPGEELAYNYGPTYFNDFIKPYGCRCAKCSPTARSAK